MYDPRSWKGEAVTEKSPTTPRDAGALGSTPEPLHPGASRLPGKHAEQPSVTAHAVVGIVPAELAAEDSMLLRDRKVSMSSAPFREITKRSMQPGRSRLWLHQPVPPVQGTAPGEREAEEVERSSPRPSLSGASCTRRVERKQAGLLRMKTETEPLEPFRERREDPAGIRLRSEPEDRIVRIANEDRISGQPRKNLLVEPEIEHFMEIDVRQDRRDHTTLWGPLLRSAPLPIFENSGFQPLVDRTTEHSVSYPLVQKAPEMAMV